MSDAGAVHDGDRTAYLHAHLDRGGRGGLFGLVHVGYASQKRTVKDSGRAYAEVISTTTHR